MIRFLNLKDQICQGQNHFAFFDTVSDIILEFAGEQVFSSLSDFETSYSLSNKNDNGTRQLERFTGLIPSDYFEPTL